jgi:Ion transport protein
MVLIISNSLLIGVFDYADRESLTYRNQVIDKVQLAFQIVFMLESVLKIIAMGFIMKPNSYLRSGWNLIDFSVILLG